MTSTVSVAAERGHQAADVWSRLDAGRGVVLTGDAGVGKSFLAAGLAALWDAEGGCAIRCHASAGSSELPLAPFVGLLHRTEGSLVILFAEVRHRLIELAAGRRLLLLIDDVNQLDEASNALVHQFVSERRAVLLATMRTGSYPSAELSDLRHRQLIDNEELAAFSASETRCFAEQLLGAPMTEESSRRLMALTDGNALFIREAVLAATEELAVEPGVEVTIERFPAESQRLVDLVRSRLAQLPIGDAAALAHLAFAEPCGPGELASVADLAGLGRLEAARLIATSEDQGRLWLRLAHPLYGEVLRHSTGLLQRRTILATLASDLAATGARRRGDVVKLARLAVDGGVHVSAGVLNQATAICIHAGHLELAERFGRRVMESSGDFVAGWDLATTLLFRGDLPALTEHLRRWQRRAQLPGEHRAVAFARAQARYWLAGDAAGAWTAAQTVLDRFPDDEDTGLPMSADEVRVNQCYMPVAIGDPTQARALADRFGSDERLHVRVRALRAACSAAILAGRLGDATEHIEQALVAHDELGPTNISALRAGMEMLQVNAWMYRGELELAERCAHQMLAEATSDAGFAFGTASLGLVTGFAGRPRAGLAILESQAARWDHGPGVMSRRWLLSMRAWLQSAAGKWAEAAGTMREIDADTSLSRHYDLLAESVRVRSLAAAGRLGDAEIQCHRWIADAAAIRHHLAEALAHYELTRLGVTTTAGRLAVLASECQSSLIMAWAAQAESLARGNLAGLHRAIDALEEMGLVVWAAEAATQALDVARRDGNQRAVNRLRVRIVELRERCEEAVPATPLLDTGPVALTRREREIAILAAQGVAARDIAARLFIARRTAETHLANVYNKLGIGTRAELARLLERDAPGFAP